MALAPVYKSADRYFNHDAAQRAFELVSKMDPDEANALITCVTADTMWADMDANQRTLQRHLDDVIRKRISSVAKVLDKTYVSKAIDALEEDREFAERDNLLAYAGALGVITKAVDFDPREHPRGHGGMFTTKLTSNPRAKPLSGKEAHSRSIPKPETKQKKLNAEQRSDYQQRYAQLANFMDTFQHSGQAGNVDFLVTFKERDGQQRETTIVHGGTDVPSWDPGKEQPIQVTARPNTLTAGGAAFGLVSALGGSQDRAMGAANAARGIGAQTKGDFSSQWNAVDPLNSNARLYNRTSLGSKLLMAVTPEGSPIHQAAMFGEFVGSHGPEAEKILGPGTRKAMYRYRGTEKTPDRELVANFNQIRSGVSADRIGPEDTKKLRGIENNAVALAERHAGQRLTAPEERAVREGARRKALGLGTDEASIDHARQRSRQYAMAFMREKVPSERLYELQLASGHTPPSEGVIIDRSGKVVTQAIGYGDDHYLPFNLKNLKGLKGGEYIRTRSVGGPTSEDIYTGLVSGAKSVTVVSRSGTFMVEFDDTFRGGRRYNQKAGRMVDRYEHLLDAVKSGQVQRQSVPQNIKAEIRERVEGEMGEFATPQMKKKEVQRLEQEYKEDPWIGKDERAQMEAEAQRHAGDDPKAYKQILAQSINAKLAEQAFNFKLNGNGYAAAIKSLQEQFPYYIASAQHMPNFDEDRFEPATDKGYVRPGRNRPAAAMAGWFDQGVGAAPANPLKDKGHKYAADEADYQVAHINIGAQRQSVASADEGTTGTGEVGSSATTEDREAKRAALEDAKARRQDLNTAAAHGYKLMERAKGASSDFRAKYTDIDSEDAFKRMQANDPTRAKAFRDDIRGVVSSASAGNDADKRLGGELDQALRMYETMMDRSTGVKYDPEVHRYNATKQPLDFDEPEYKRGGNQQRKQTALDKLTKFPSPSGVPLNEMTTDAEFVKAINNLADIKSQMNLYTNLKGDAVERESFGDYLTDKAPGFTGVHANQLIANPTYLDNIADATQRARTLRSRITEVSQDRIMNTPSGAGSAYNPPPTPPSGPTGTAPSPGGGGVGFQSPPPGGAQVHSLNAQRATSARSKAEGRIGRFRELARRIDDENGTTDRFTVRATTLSDEHKERMARAEQVADMLRAHANSIENALDDPDALDALLAQTEEHDNRARKKYGL